MVYCLSDGKNGIHRFYNKPEGSVRIGEFGRLPLADKFTVKTCRCKRKEKRAACRSPTNSPSKPAVAKEKRSAIGIVQIALKEVIFASKRIKC